MVKVKLKTEIKSDSLSKVFLAIKKKKSFILEAGAGSGKTWTLVECLKYIIQNDGQILNRNNQKIVCITYTNVAANEIKSRIENNPLVAVSTIHDFLWDVIKNYQNEIKKEIIEYNATVSKKPIENLSAIIEDLTIKYLPYGRNFEKGRITHDDVIDFSNKIFSKYKKILKIVAETAPYIFVDEYQDTQQQTVDLLLNRLLPENENKIVVGFFGDSMQKIYNQGVGKILNDKLEVITKTENFRCSLKVIDLLKNIRPSLEQYASGKNLKGEVCFFHCNNSIHQNEANYSKVEKTLRSKYGWSFGSSDTKVLILTHKGIANKLDYQNLLDSYESLGSFGKDQLMQQEEPFSEFLIGKKNSDKPSVEKLYNLYDKNKFGEFINSLSIEGFKIQKHSDKQKLKNIMDKLDSIRKSGTVKNVLDYIFDHNILNKPHRIIDFEERISRVSVDADEKIKKMKIFYDLLMQIKYSELINFSNYIQEFTPFSTKHGVKGAEYENVLIVIDDASWNQYKFNDVFGQKKGSGQYERTLNLLYVCCSRAKNKLAILSLSAMDAEAMKTINTWFENNKIFDVAQL